MAFLKDIQDKIILGRWRFLNLKPLESTTLKPLSIDEHGNLGIGEDASGDISELEDRVDAVEGLAGTALQPGDTIPVDDISGLGTAATANTEDFLDAGYTPAWGDVSGKPTTFPPSTHTHTIAQVTGLQDELDSKADSTDIPDVSGFATTNELTTGLSGKANTSHTHTIAQITGLQGELDSKLTATQGAAVPDGSTVDDLLASLRAAGLIAE